jgi:serine protease
LRFLGAEGGTTTDAIECIQAAVAAGADVISMSYGSYYRSRAEENALKNAYASGCVLIAAAGNSGNSWKSYPAGYDVVVSVAAIDSLSQRGWFSTYNSDVELAAPGVGVKSTVPGGGYEIWNGTSMATPHVSGVAALVRAAHPTWTPVQVRQAMTATAVDLGAAGRDVYFGYGLVDALAAASYTPPTSGGGSSDGGGKKNSRN